MDVDRFFPRAVSGVSCRSKSFQPQSNSYKAHNPAAVRFVQLKNGTPCAYT